MAGKGWIALHRKIEESWLWNADEPFDRRSAWIDLLLMANHEDKKILIDGDLVEVKRGQRITSSRKLSERWKWSRTKIKKFLEMLEKDEMIYLKTDNKKTTYTIVNYNDYQDLSTTEKPQKDQRSTTEKPQKDTNNNDITMMNNDNNDDIEKLLQEINSISDKKQTSSSLQKFLLEFSESDFKNLITEVKQSEYLKKNIDLNIANKKFIKKALNGSYRDFKKTEKRNAFDNFESETKQWTDEDFEEIAKRKREEFLKNI